MKRKDFIKEIEDVCDCEQCPIVLYCRANVMCVGCSSTAAKFWKQYGEEIRKCQTMEDLTARFMFRMK